MLLKARKDLSMKITSEVTEIFKMLVDKPLEDMGEEELRGRYRDAVNLILGMFIGSAVSTERIKNLIYEIHKGSQKENREESG